jgi:beta-phosphoglucomutase
MSVKAVIFDMDGVLVDSMGYHVQAWQKVFKPLGLDISSYEVYAREGENWRKTTGDFLRMAGHRPAPAFVKEVFTERGRIFKKIFKPQIFQGAERLLLLLKKKRLKLGLVTATPRKDVYQMLPDSMLRLFDFMVCGGDTKKGKPHPEPYLKVLKGLKISPEVAMVVENAPYGIASCKQAGLRCIAVATSLPMKYLKGADIVVNSLKEVREYFCSKAQESRKH